MYDLKGNCDQSGVLLFVILTHEISSFKSDKSYYYNTTFYVCNEIIFIKLIFYGTF